MVVLCLWYVDQAPEHDSQVLYHRHVLTDKKHVWKKSAFLLETNVTENGSLEITEHSNLHYLVS